MSTGCHGSPRFDLQVFFLPGRILPLTSLSLGLPQTFPPSVSLGGTNRLSITQSRLSPVVFSAPSTSPPGDADLQFVHRVAATSRGFIQTIVAPNRTDGLLY